MPDNMNISALFAIRNLFDVSNINQNPYNVQISTRKKHHTFNAMRELWNSTKIKKNPTKNLGWIWRWKRLKDSECVRGEQMQHLPLYSANAICFLRLFTFIICSSARCVAIACFQLARCHFQVILHAHYGGIGRWRRLRLAWRGGRVNYIFFFAYKVRWEWKRTSNLTKCVIILLAVFA